ncbi:TPA: cytochrome c maturation protein CcmE [Enterobacter hormaechei subsp. xiangfangensis]|nr:cytochrome c maturation protein CcmE [Enterobacter hormaechei subsp. xiangfangensis]
MLQHRKVRLLTVCAIVFGVAITLALALYALRSSIDLFYTPTEILQGKHDSHQKPSPGQHLRVGGLVMPGSVKRDPHNVNVAFRLYDGKNNVLIYYTGILPDLFREGQGVVAQGIFMGKGVIQAQDVLAKHDENYTPPEIANSLTSKARNEMYKRRTVP